MAVEDVKSSFPNIDLHHRLAILVPNKSFASSLKSSLKKIFQDLKHHHENLQFIDAVEAARSIERHKKIKSDPSSIIVDTV